MSRLEAQAQCAARNREAERAGGERWLPRQVAPDDWRPVRIRVAGLPPRTPLSATVEARPRPSIAEDPRSGPLRDAPPFGAA